MLSPRDEILQQILTLSPEDRAFVVAALEQSLGDSPPDAVDGDSPDTITGVDLLSELQRRSGAYREGQTAARSADEVLTDLRRRQADESRVKMRILAEAEAEMESARQYLEARQPGLGDRFLVHLSSTLTVVSDRPLSFPKLETLPDEQPYRRALLRAFRYAVVFELVDDEVVVVALVHSSRAPNYWLGRPS